LEIGKANTDTTMVFGMYSGERKGNGKGEYTIASTIYYLYTYRTVCKPAELNVDSAEN